METEKRFLKYETLGPDYHYRQMEKNVFRFNLFVFTRYQKQVEIVEICLNEKIKSSEKIKLLDVGCGDGVLLYLLKKKFGQRIELYGVDSSEEALVVARQKIPNVHAVCFDVYRTDFPENFFDIVVSSDVIEHVLFPKKMLTEIQRVAKMHADILIGTPVRFTEKPLDPNHAYEFFQEEFLELMNHFFSASQIRTTHSLILSLLYRQTFWCFGKKIPLIKYLFNILYIYFGINLFASKKQSPETLMSYMLIHSKKGERKI